MLDSTTARDLIKPHMLVVGSQDDELSTVDQIDGHGLIKLAKDDDGEHHYIPLEWVTAVDDKVHIDRSSQQAKREWTTTPPKQ